MKSVKLKIKVNESKTDLVKNIRYFYTDVTFEKVRIITILGEQIEYDLNEIENIEVIKEGV